MSKLKKYKLKGQEKIISDLQSLVDSRKVSSDELKTARSLLSYFINRHELTVKQVKLAKLLISRNSANKSRKPNKYYLYAISGGEHLKIGVSTNPDARVKDLQTSNPEILKVVWRYYVGNHKGRAYNFERKLHKVCKKFRVRGEWFNPECLDLVLGLKPKTSRIETK